MKKKLAVIIMLTLVLSIMPFNKNEVFAAEKTFKAAYFYGDKYDEIYGVVGNTILAEKNGNVGLVSLDGKELTGFKYDVFGYQPISANKKYILIRDENLNWFVLDINGKIVTELGKYNDDVYFYRQTNIIECRNRVDGVWTYEYKETDGSISAMSKYLDVDFWSNTGTWFEVLDDGKYFVVYDAIEEQRIKLLDSNYNVVTTFETGLNKYVDGKKGLIALSGDKGKFLYNYDGTRVSNIDTENINSVEKNGNLIMGIYAEYGYDESGYEIVTNYVCKIMDLNGNVLDSLNEFDYKFHYGGGIYEGFLIQNDYDTDGTGIDAKYIYDGDGKVIYELSGYYGYSISENRKYIALRDANDGLVIIDYKGNELAVIKNIVGSMFWVEDYLMYYNKNSQGWTLVDRYGKEVLTKGELENVGQYTHSDDEVYFEGWLPSKKSGKWTLYKYTDENIKLVDITKVENKNNSSSSNITKPAKVSLKSAINKKGKKVKLTWKKIKKVAGYQIQYATNKKFTKNLKKTTAKKSATSKTIKKLKKKKTYYFRVRAYKTANGKKVYGAWSKVKKVKIKK